MPKSKTSHKELLPHLFRQEYVKMVAVLCRHFGLSHIEIAEDIASDTFLKASENWAINGIPENPSAWLYTVAKNKAKDHFKHITVFKKRIKDAIKPNEIQTEEDFEFSNDIIMDSQLAMIFAVCNPSNPIEAQICLSLQVLCGFSIHEIASAFLSKPGTIKKRLFRARINLRNDNFQIKILRETEIQSRLDTVLKTIYLLFNEGYFSKTNNQLIRKELCSEAVRLALILTKNPLTDTPQTKALIALMCFQSSRLEARMNDKGEVITYNEQDKNLWDKTLIEKGNYYLVDACDGSEISKYHFEAGIAYWHSTPTAENKWQHILQLYNQLVILDGSPITVLNKTFVFGQVYGFEKAIIEGEKLNLKENNHYHELLGHLYVEINIDKAIHHYRQAINLTKSKIEKQALIKEIERLNEKNDMSR